MKVNIVNHSPNPLPAYETEGAACMDVRAWVTGPEFTGHCADYDEISECIRIFPGGRALISTGLEIDLEPGYECQLRPRSGLALKHAVTLGNCIATIDSDYKKTIGVILINLGDEAFEVHTGDRIAQMVIAPVLKTEWNQVDFIEQNGRGGFMSTGLK